MVKEIVAVSLILIALTGCNAADMSLSANRDATGRNYSGYVYDIDYLENQGWTQILIMPPVGGSNLVSQTDNAVLQAILESALLDKLLAEVAYNESGNAGPVKLLAAAVSAGPTGCFDKGCVKRVSCASNGECSAQIYAEPREAKTKNLRAVGVLLTAMNKKKAVEYLDLDNASWIKRVKINIPG